MSLPLYNPQGGSGGSFFGSIRTAAVRELNKARARFWPSASTVSSWVKLAGNPIKSVGVPVKSLADTTVKAVDKSVGAVVSGFKWGAIILVVLAGLIVMAYLRPFLPSKSK